MKQQNSKSFLSWSHRSALLVLLALAPVALALLGDVDDDGSITATDATWVMESVAGSRNLDATESVAADVDDTGTVDAADAQWLLKLTAGEVTGFPPQLARTSGPVAVSRDGSLVGVVNPDNDSVTFLSGSDETILAEVLTGREPIGISFSRDGAKAYVSNSRDRTVAVIDTAAFTVSNQISVGAEPFGVVVNHRGDKAFVSNMMSGTVSVLNLASETETAEVAVAPKPQGMAVSADGSRLYVTHLTAAQISVIDTATLGVTSIALAETTFNPLDTTTPAGVANRIKGIALRPGSDEAWVPHILSNIRNSVEVAFNSGIFPAVSVIDTNTQMELTGNRMTLFAGILATVAHPEAVAFSADGLLGYVVSAASNDLTIFNATTRQQVGLLRDVGDNPRGIALHPDGSKAYVFSRLSPTLSVVDLGSETVSATIAVAPDLMAPALSEGRRVLFSSATPDLSRDRFMACASCHFDGREDGQTWLFANGPRQTQTMAGDSTRSGLQHHNGDRLNLQDFAIAFTGLQGGTGLTPDQLDNMAAFANEIRFLDNPNVAIDGTMLNAQAFDGRRLFKARGCDSCHNGPFLTDADGNNDLSEPLLKDVGTFTPGNGTQDGTDRTRDQSAVAGGTVRPAGFFETSYLVGINATAPYLHNGTAATLRETLTAVGNPQDLHGVTLDLTTTELDQLVAYLDALDIRNRRVRITLPADGAPTADLVRIRGTTFDNVQSLDLYINGAGPLAATLNGTEFDATVPANLVPALANGISYMISARGINAKGEAARDDIAVNANFNASTDVTQSTVTAQPALLIADGNATSTVVLTPRNTAGDLLGSGLSLDVQTTLGTLGAVVDQGDGTYAAVLTAGMSAGNATVSANVAGEAVWIDTAAVTLTAGDVDPATSSITATVLSLEADGLGTVEITVLPRDAFGNNLSPGQTVLVSVDLGTISPVTDEGDGRYTAIYTAAINQGLATVMATVNGVQLNLMPQISLQPDLTAPAAANPEAITFSAVLGGVTTITGGAGAVEGIATVRVENLETGQFALATANADGSFSVQLAVGVNEQVSIRVDDIAGNMSSSVIVTPFPVEVLAITGVVQTPVSGGGFTPVSGATVVLYEIDLSGAPSLVFNALAIPSVTTAGDGSYVIPLPLGFVPDPELIVVTGPDTNGDGFIEAFSEYVYVNDTSASITVDVIGTAIINGIANNFFWLNGPAVPASHFTPTERIDIDSTLRAATTEIDFFGLDASTILGTIGNDVFFDVAPDALDTLAKTTFELAAQSPGDSDPPVTLTGRLNLPDGAGGNIPLSGVQVQMGTLAFNNPPSCNFPICVSLITGALATTDGSGDYSLLVPGFVDPGTSSVIVAVGDLTYDGGGAPGPFVGGGSLYSLAGFYLDPVADMDVAARAAASLIQLQGVPIENFNATEMTQLIDLLRVEVAGLSVVTANKTLGQVFVEIFNLLAVDPDVVALLTAIADPQQNTDTTIVTANPTSITADGISISTITIEPRDQLAQPVGPGRIVEMTTTAGTIKTPAIDNGDGFYTAFLTAPTTPGSATVAASIEGVVFDQQPVVTFTADVSAPAAPLAAEIVFINVGTTATVIGLPGAVEAFSIVEIENVTLGLTVMVTANSDGSFRADISGSAGDALLVRSEDAAGNVSTDTNVSIDSGLTLPAIVNPADVPAGVVAGLSPLDEGDFGIVVPAGYSYLAGVSLDLEGKTASTALQIMMLSGVPVTNGAPVVLAQELQLTDRTVWRVLAPATSAAGVLFPMKDAAYPGVTTGGKLAYLLTTTPIAFVHGNVSGDRGMMGGSLVRVVNSEFEDLSREDGRYLLVGDVNTTQQFVSAQPWLHVSATGVDTLMSYPGSVTRRDFAFTTRAETIIGFTQRFNFNGGQSDRLFVKPDGTQIYLMREVAGDLEVIDTDSLADASLIDNPQSLTDLSFTPNGAEAFMAAFGRVRELNAGNEQLGLEEINAAFPKSVAVTPNGELVFAASSLDNSSADSDPDAVFVMNSFTNVLESGSIAIAPDPSDIAINRAGDRVYVLSEAHATLSVIDVATRAVLDEMPLGSAPSDLVIAHDGATLYVVDGGSNDLLLVDAALAEDTVPGNEITATLAIGANPRSVTLHPDGQTLYITEADDDTVSVVDASGPTLLSVWAATDRPRDLVVHPDGTLAYVVDTDERQGVMEIVIRAADDVAPQVLDVGPKDRSTRLLQDSPIEIVFSEPMDAATLSAANIAITDVNLAPVPGTIAMDNNGVTAVFTPAQGTRYLLNSQITVDVSTPTDAMGNILGASVNRQVPTFTMQLPVVAQMSIDISAAGVVANGAAGAVEPLSTVTITNLTSGAVFSGQAGVDGSYSVSLIGLDNDGYELVSSLEGGRAATDPLLVPVNFSVQFPNPGLFSYAPGPAGTITVTGAPGAVDVKTTLLTLTDTATQTEHALTNIAPDGSFSVDLMLAQGVTLDAQSTLLDSVVLDSIAVPGHGFPGPSLELAAPNVFVIGMPVNIVIAGQNFGGNIGDHLLTVDGSPLAIDILDVLDTTGQPAIQFAIPLGVDGGLVRVAYAGQTSNGVQVQGEQPANTDPIAESVIATSVPDATGMLGFADGVFVDLGQGGFAVIELGTTARQGFGADLRIFEDTSDGQDCYNVLVSSIVTGPFILLGEFCGTRTVDLGSVSQARFVRIEDADDGGPAAAIDAIQVLNIKIALLINEVDAEGNPIRQVYPSAPKANNSRALTVTPSETDAGLCPTDTKMFSVTISPAPTTGAYYGPPACTDTVTWTVAGTDSTVTSPGMTTTFTAGMMTGRAVVTATATRSGGSGCTDSGTATINVDVVKVGMVEWVAMDSPLSANDHPSGTVGMKIFPDATSPTDSTNRRKVKIKATTDPPVEDVELHFKLLDVDDPSTDMAPVDANAMGGDNRDALGALSAMMKKTDASGEAEIEYDVGRRAGDNYRVAASCNSADFTMPVAIDDNSVPGSDAQVPMFPGSISPLLTVWRRLHVEVDSMGAPPTGVNEITGRFRNFVSTANTLTTATELSNTTSSLDDGSADLDSGSPDNGRFENGMLGVPDLSGTTVMVIGNGNNRATFASASVLPQSFAAEDNDFIFPETMSGTVTQITKSGSNFVYTLNITSGGTIDWPDFVGGEINVAGGDDVPITAVNSVAMTVTSSGLNIPFAITDDDTVPADVPNPDTGYMVTGWKPAYMDVVFDTGANSPSTTFDLNSLFPEGNALINADKGVGASTVNYWVVTVLGGFQLGPFDPGGYNDNDPDREGTSRAWALRSDGNSFMATEDLRDWIATPSAQGGAGGVDPDTTGEAGRQPRRQEVLNHEVGHLFGLGHPDGNTTANNPNGGVMRPSNVPRQSHKFSEISLDKMRNVASP